MSGHISILSNTTDRCDLDACLPVTTSVFPVVKENHSNLIYGHSNIYSMKKIIPKQVGALLLSVLGLAGLQAQENLPATGGDALDSSGSVSYSVGQVMYTAHRGSNGTVELGVQQPFEISVVTDMKENQEIKILVSVYPNPSTDHLQLKVEGGALTGLRYMLFNMNGQRLESNDIEGDHTVIETGHLMPATYFLKVLQDNSIVKTFQIIKN